MTPYGYATEDRPDPPARAIPGGSAQQGEALSELQRRTTLATKGSVDKDAVQDHLGGPDIAEIDETAFAAGLEPVKIVSVLPNPVGYVGPSVLFLTTDQKLYRYDPAIPEFRRTQETTDLTGQIVGTQITDGAVTTPKLFAGSVTADKIGANQVVAGKIAADAVIAGTIAVGAINASGLIVNGTIITAHMTAGTIDANVLTALSITSGLIGAGEIVAGKIAVGGVSGSTQIANGIITTAHMTVGTINADRLTAGTITSGLIGADQIIAGKIAANAVTAGDIAADAVQAGNIAALAVQAGEIAANAVDTSELNAGAVTAVKIASGTITALQIQAGTITGTEITGTTLSGIFVNAGLITAGKMQAAADRFLDLDASGSGAFLKHGANELRADGTSTGWKFDSAQGYVDLDPTNNLTTTIEMFAQGGVGGTATFQIQASKLFAGANEGLTFTEKGAGRDEFMSIGNDRGSQSIEGFYAGPDAEIQTDLYIGRNLIFVGAAEISAQGGKITCVEAFEVEGVFDVRNAADTNLNFRVEDGGEVQIKEGFLRLGETATNSQIFMEDADAGAANKVYSIIASGNRYELRFYNDAESAHNKAIEIARSGTTVAWQKLGGVYQNGINGTEHALYVDSAGELGQQTSSRRFKKNLKAVTAAYHDRIHQLELHEFDFKVSHGGRHSIGLVAEEVIDIMPEIVGMDKDFENTPGSVHYEKLIPHLLRECQELRKRVQLLEAA